MTCGLIIQSRGPDKTHKVLRGWRDDLSRRFMSLTKGAAVRRALLRSASVGNPGGIRAFRPAP